MFNTGQKVMIKSSGTVGVVRSVADNGDLVIQTINGTYGYTKANAKKYLSPSLDSCDCQCLTRETVELKNIISGKTLKQMQKEYGMAQGALSFRSRCTGKTTGIAFAVVGAALQHPATEIPYVDHHDSVTARENLYYAICMMIDKLGLKGLDVNKQKRTVIFYPFVEVHTTYEPKTVITPVR